ncbi:UNVERIFIED_ORG: hypothetical protein MaF1725_ph0096 [Mycobacterium phage ADLER F1725]
MRNTWRLIGYATFSACVVCSTRQQYSSADKPAAFTSPYTRSPVWMSV